MNPTPPVSPSPATPAPLLFDAHLDLAMNAIEWNRDLTRPLAEIRARESHLRDKPDRGRGTVCLPELRRGGVRLVVATLIARIEHNAFSPVAGWASPAQAWAMTQGQRAWYRAMEEAGEMTLIHDRATLEAHLARPADSHAIGTILSLEGADSIRTLHDLEHAWEDGLRAIGPAHYGPGVYANGTDSTGGFNARGKDLLREMDRLGYILDVTHLCDDCFWEALDLYQGPVWASHQNCRAIVPHNRQMTDEMIQALVQRRAVVGAALDAWMIVPGWIRQRSTPQSTGVRINHVVDHIDHFCQVAGSTHHAGIGSDLDGAFGTEQTPGDLDSIADLPRILDLLGQRGYSNADLDEIRSGNFVEFLRRTWRA
ncbi:MAG: dipeptidase [Limisphaerales bacterium]